MLGEATQFIDAILRQDAVLPARRHHTIRRIWERLLDEHDVTASYSTVRDYVLRHRRQHADLPPETAATQGNQHAGRDEPDNRLPHEVRSALRYFAFVLANGTLAPEILGDIDYRPHLTEFGSELEMAFAVFTNVLTVDEHGHVTNQAHAHCRAAQWIRAYCSPSYQIEPPLQTWEVELI